MGVFGIFFASLVAVTCIPSSLEISVDVLPPVNKTGPEVGLIVVPGAFIAGSAYKPLGETIQKESDLKVWVALLDGFLGNLVNNIQLSGAINKAKTQLHHHGVQKIFIAGHSLGGTLTANYVLNHPHSLMGAMLFGSYLASGNKLADFPVPVLTLSGDLDGVTRITRIQETFEELQLDVSQNKTSIYKTPVITMEGVNHGQFASGVMPSTVQVYDIEADVTNATAYSMIARYTNAFMAANSQPDDAITEKAKQVLMEGFTSTRTIITPLTNLKHVSVNPLHVSQWAGQAQRMVAGLRDEAKLKVVNVEVSTQQLLRSTPKFEIKNDAFEITTYTHVSHQLNPLDVSTFDMSPNQLMVEMLSRDAIRARLANETFLDNNETCLSINKVALQYAQGQASSIAANRFTKRGRPMIFEPDVEVYTTQSWVLQELFLDDEKDGLHVTSEFYYLPYKKTENSMTGLYYCKLLAPYRAMEWIYVDSLRKWN